VTQSIPNSVEEANSINSTQTSTMMAQNLQKVADGHERLYSAEKEMIVMKKG